MKTNSNIKPSMIYNLTRCYLRFVHNKLYYRDYHIIDKHKIPQDGTPVLIVSNHQNCLNDPLAVQFTFYDRKINVFARADVFKNPIARRFLNFLGLIPAYRMSHEGIESVGNNRRTFDIASDELVKGRTVLMYPEAGHQTKRWLGNFSMAYIILAFEAAEKADFKKEVYILPSCNHYTSYFHMQSDILVKYGDPIALSPYYEKYKSKPRTVQREINKLVRERISELMLNVEDLDNYDAIDYIRNSYGVEFAKEQDLDPKYLPEKLKSDKQLVKILDEYKLDDPIGIKEIYRLANEAKELEEGFNFRNWNYEKKFSVTSIGSRILVGILLLPLFLISLLPNIFIFLAPKLITRRIEDHMFDGSIYYGLSALLTIPVLYLTTFFVLLNLTGLLWFAAGYLCLLPLLGLFAWKYRIGYIKLKSEIRFKIQKNKGKLDKLLAIRKSLFGKLRKIESSQMREAI